LVRRSTRTGPATIKDIAKVAGLSSAAVSRALRNDLGISEATRKRVKQIAGKLGYKRNWVGAALSTGRTQSILFVVPYDPSEIPQSNLLYMEVLEGAAEELAAFGYSVEIALEKSLRTRSESIVEAIANSRAEGSIIVVMNVDESLRRMKASPIPVVVVNQVFPSRTMDFVVADDRFGAFNATEYLIKAGHTDIAHICGPLKYYASRERRAGYIEALEAHGLAHDPNLMRETLITMRNGQDAAESLLAAGGRFSAIFSSDDVLSSGIMAALRGRGLRIPEDVSIVSFDDELLASIISPPLTTVRKPRREMGRTAAQMVLNRIRANGSGSGAVTELKTVFVERLSVAPPPQASGRKRPKA
jgi:LacI family repressor for deo operon, udp, cdd, tsx, nupC, and nupG